MIVAGLAAVSSRAQDVQPMGLFPGTYVLRTTRDATGDAARIRLPAVCMDLHATVPSEMDSFTFADGGIRLTSRDAHGNQRDLSLQDALSDGVVRVTGSGLPLFLMAEIVAAHPETEYAIHIPRPTVIAPTEEQRVEVHEACWGSREKTLVMTAESMVAVYQALGRESWLSRALHHVHQEVCWQTQLGTIDNAAELEQGLQKRCASVLQDLTAASVIHGTPLAEAQQRRLDGLFGTDLGSQDVAAERLSNPMVSLVFPNLGLSRQRFEHSISGDVIRLFMAFVDGDSIVDELQQLPVVWENAPSDDWHHNFSDYSEADAVCLSVTTSALTDRQTEKIGYRVYKIRPNSLAQNDLEADIDLAHCLRAMLSSGSDDGLSGVAATLIAGGWHVGAVQYEAAFTESGVRERAHLPMSQTDWLLPLDSSFTRHISGEVISVSALAIDGEAFLNHHQEMSRRLNASSEEPAGENLLALIKGIRGTVFLASSMPAGRMAAITCGIQRSEQTDTMVAAFVSSLGGNIDSNGAISLPANQTTHWARNLSRHDDYWVVSTGGPRADGDRTWASTEAGKQMTAEMGGHTWLFAFLDQQAVAANPMLPMIAAMVMQEQQPEIAKQFVTVVDAVKQKGNAAFMTGRIGTDACVFEGESLLGWPTMIALIGAFNEQMGSMF